MMLSPEGFYEMELKGKSADEIQLKIRGLKNEIGRLKSLIESQEIDPMPFTCPMPATQIACYRLYLKRAIQALLDAGGQYDLSQQEKLIQYFDESIPFIGKIEFSYGGFLYGYEKRTITISGENLSLDVDYNFQIPKDKEPFAREFSGIKTPFLETLASLHIGEWDNEYCDYNVLDGSDWDLSISFSNGHRLVKKSGSNAYPYNFDDFYDLMKLEENDEFSGNE